MLVLAILIVLVKFEGIATVAVRVGTILFCIAVLLSLLAGLCVNLTGTGGSQKTQRHRGTAKGKE